MRQGKQMAKTGKHTQDSGNSWQIAALDMASRAALAAGIAGGLAVLAYAAWGLL